MDIERITDVVVRWAAKEPLVEAVYLYGSYAKGCATDESDIDLAVTFRATATRKPLGIFIEQGETMGRELSKLLGKQVQLEPLDKKAAIVWKAVREHGIHIFQAQF